MFLIVVSGKKEKNPKSRFHIQGHRDGGGSWTCHGRDPALACSNFETVGCGTSLHSGIPLAFLIHSGSSSPSRPDTGSGRPGSGPAHPLIPQCLAFWGFPPLYVKLQKSLTFLLSQGWVKVGTLANVSENSCRTALDCIFWGGKGEEATVKKNKNDDFSVGLWKGFFSFS